MSEEIRLVGFTVLGSTIITLLGFVIFRVLKQHRIAIGNRIILIGPFLANLVDTIGRKLTNRDSRRKIRKVAILLGLLSAGVYYLPILVSSSKSDPLHGNFDVELMCMGGHEIFLELTGDTAFENCPGHRDRKKVASIIRDNDSVTVIDPRDDQPWFRIDWDGKKHTLDFLKRPDSQSMFGMIAVRGEVSQMNNPWRLWIPLILPEH